VRGSTSAVTGLPLTVRETAAMSALLEFPLNVFLQDGSRPFSASKVETATILPVSTLERQLL
jgi:hypothetical protein